MQGDFDNWESDSGTQNYGGRPSSGLLPGSGGWHWLQTLVALLIVGLISMACAWLTRNVEERPVWMMGLIFMMPTAALMAATMIVEKNTSAMTPTSSRRPQMILAVTATVLTFVVACICDLIYLYGFKKPLPPSSIVNTPYEVSDRLLIITDRTGSMAESGADKKSASTVKSLLDQCEPDWEVGMVSGDTVIPLASLSEKQKKRLNEEAGKTPDQGRMYYLDSVSAALDMAEKAGSDRQTRILLLTDGLHTWSRTEDTDLTERFLKANATISCVHLGSGDLDPVLSSLIQATGGEILTQKNASWILEEMETVRFRSVVSPAGVEEKLKLDLLRNREPAAILISCIMLLLEGLSLGICISLMLSMRGQFRLQYILSPLMGLLAFALLKYIWDNNDIATTWWIKEGVAFSLLGVVLMKRNRRPGAARAAEALSASMANNDNDF